MKLRRLMSAIWRLPDASAASEEDGNGRPGDRTVTNDSMEAGTARHRRYRTVSDGAGRRRYRRDL